MTEGQAAETQAAETVQHEPVTVSAQGGNIAVGVDLNRDGNKSLTLEVSLDEAIKELLHKEAVEKVARTKVSYAFEGATLVLRLDSDQDGKPVATLRANLIELITEGKAKLA